MKKHQIITQYKIHLIAVLACCFQVAGLSGLTAGEIKLKDLQKVYDGKPKWPRVSTTPENLTYKLFYRDRSLPPVPAVTETVYDSLPGTLALSYLSTALSGNKIQQVGNVIRPDGEGRELESCETTLVTWARAKDYPALAAANPDGYLHPVTMAIYRINEGGHIVPLASQTLPVMVPWRPEKLPNGDPYPYNGCAFRVNFRFPAGILLPERMLYAVGFNTRNAGSPKMPTAGPWDSLNVALFNPKPSIGEDENATDSYVLYETGWTSVYWPSLSGPMLRMTARAPQGETTTPPVNAGVYDVRAEITTTDETAQTSGVLVVRKAPSDIHLNVPGGNGTGVSWQTYTDGVPSSLEVALTWNGSSRTPDEPGLYNVEATITDPNHEGSASTVVRVGDKFANWIRRAGGETSELAGDLGLSGADPDHDGRPNLLEYAFSHDPVQPDTDNADPDIQLAPSGDGGLILTWRVNPAATDLACAVERTATPAVPGSWAAVGDAVPEIVSETETIRVLRLRLPAPAPGEGSGFFRVRVSQ